MYKLLRAIPIFLALYACESVIPAVPDASTTLDGPTDGLTPSENAAFIRGDKLFNDVVFTSANGLGPIFVAPSCGSCHPADGKGHPSLMVTKFTGGFGSPQLQNRSIVGYEPEILPVSANSAQFLAPSVSGLGFIEAVSDNTILEWEDVDDDNGDGISGRVSWVSRPTYSPLHPNSIEQNGKVIGRFGKKASKYDLLHQTATAFSQDIGIVSTHEPISPFNGLSEDPEITEQAINDVVLYLRMLKVPPRRGVGTSSVMSGQVTFIRIGCASCHRPSMETTVSPISALSRKQIFPYSDFLLHDMGIELTDGYTEGTATTSEWRTAPLWGIGLSKYSQGGRMFLLHDGRATSVHEAIMYHGGEAQTSKMEYLSMPSHERANLLQFLESL